MAAPSHQLGHSDALRGERALRQQPQDAGDLLAGRSCSTTVEHHPAGAA
ncbi:MAG: hypothetical protein R2749_29975 [Acidimicrobiales bacterium]